jgi:(R,R)-butanediol dehydrogenase/meso-butanediol dehydrogenase/diacetyl reductase
MRAAVFNKPGEKLEIRDVPAPDPGEGEVLLRVHRCGICGTDLHMTDEHNSMGAPPGYILGHERSAEVVAIGKGVDRLKVGDHVVPHPTKGCGQCAPCKDGSPYFCVNGFVPWFGGFAEYMTALDASCARLPNTLSLDDAAIIEPLAVGLLGIECNPFTPGANIVVIGTGPIGIAAAFWARRANAGKIASVASSRTREYIARAVGVDAFFTTGENLVGELHEFFGGMPDLVLECAGFPGAISLAVDIVKPQGSVNVLGICEHQDPWMPAMAVYKQLRLQFAVGTQLRMFEHAANTLDRGIVDPLAMVTDIVSFEQLPEAFEALKARTTQCKVVLDPWL